MKKNLFSILAAMALVGAGLFFGSCSGSSSSNYQEKIINPSSGVTATSIELIGSASVSPYDAMSTLSVSVTPANARVNVWSESDTALFIGEPVYLNGFWFVMFKPYRQGTFVITAQSGSVSKTLSINVVSKLVSIEVTGCSSPIDKGGKVQLTAKKNPWDAPDALAWASSNTDIATVDQNGLVTAVAPGFATITASAGSITGYLDVAVKGFYINEDLFFLCVKNFDDNAEAKLVGIEDGTVTWTSDKPSLFTVTADASDSKKAVLNYVNGASGEATLTATLTTAGGATYSDTAKVIVEKFSMLALGDSIAAGYAPEALGPEDKDLEEPAMIEAYKKYMSRRKGGTDPNYVNEYCYSAILAKNFAQSANTKLLSYARTGDQTKDLIEKLKPDYRDGELATRTGETLDAVKKSDFITLCIGANDILQRATGMNLLFQDLDWFRTTFASDLATFKTNFDSILATLTNNGQRVYVMSVYSPYHYYTWDNIPESERTGNFEAFIKKLVAVNGIAEGFLDQMNAYIKQKADANASVKFVDVAATLNVVPKDEHKTY
ncbi:MAG: Ig-like domain-containing protein, partial [Treponema sp.]|nr:Ig-like domain-containing protein [Treponema sp.]